MRRAEGTAGLLALALGLLHWWLAPWSGTDLAAQVARAAFAGEHPLAPVDLAWYGGVHPFSYSLLSPWLMSVTGVQLGGLLAAVVGAVLLARLLRDSERPWLASVTGAVFLVANLVSGRTTFALGAAAGLAALVCLPHRGRAAVLAVLTALLSPVAAAFLGLAAAVLVLHRRTGGWVLGLCASVPVVLLSLLFPAGGVQPFSTSSAVPALVAAAVLAVLARNQLVRTGALLYALALVAFVLHDDPFGSNVLRLGLLLAVPVLLASVRGHAFLVLAASVYLLSWQAGPPQGDLDAPEDPPLEAVTAELLRRGAHRVEAVAPRQHTESAALADHVNLARGWSRQLDRERNPLFYDGTLTAATYRAWLRERGVDHVALPRTGEIDWGSAAEARLLRTTRLGLQQVWQDRHWTLYRVPDPEPLVGAPARLLTAGRAEWRLQSLAAGEARVKLQWSRWLSVEGPGCVARDGEETVLRLTGPGEVVLGSSLRPKGRC